MKRWDPRSKSSGPRAPVIAGVGLLVAALATAACRRDPPAATDAGPAPAVDVEPAADGVADLAADVSPPAGPRSCEAMARFATPLRLISFSSRQASFAPGLAALALVSHVDEAPGQLVVIELPSARRVPLAEDVAAAEWLDPRRLIATVSVFGLRPLPDPFQPGGYDLDLFEPAAPPERRRTTLAGRVCGHRASPDGSRVAVVTGCVGGRGTLGLVRPVEATEGSEPEPLAEDVQHDLRWSADGRYLAYLTGPGMPGCDGRLWIHDLAEGRGREVAGGATAPRFVASGALVFDRCGSEGELRAYHPAEQRVVPLGVTLAWRWGASDCPARQTYRVSAGAGGAWLLGGMVGEEGKGPARHLVAVGLGGEGQRLIAADLFPLALSASFAFGAGGERVVYARVGQSFGELAVVDNAGGGPGAAAAISTALAAGNPFSVSPAGDEVAFVERHTDRLELRLAPLNGEPSRALYRPYLERQLSYAQTAPRYLPDGRALLWAGRVAGRLAYLPRGQGAGPAQVLGQLDPELPLGCGGYLLDASGCLALYNAPGGGTTVVKLPITGVRAP